MKCLKCGSDNMTVVQETDGFSLAGVLAAILFLIGLFVLLVNIVAGAILVLAAFLIGIFGRGKSSYAVCLACRYKSRL